MSLAWRILHSIFHHLHTYLIFIWKLSVLGIKETHKKPDWHWNWRKHSNLICCALPSWTKYGNQSEHYMRKGSHLLLGQVLYPDRTLEPDCCYGNLIIQGECLKRKATWWTTVYLLGHKRQLWRRCLKVFSLRA